MVRVSEPNGRDHHPGPEAGDDFPSGADAPIPGGETAGGGATVAQWISGARPRTWPNAFAPVIAGSAVAAFAGEFVWWKALLALGQESPFGEWVESRAAREIPEREVTTRIQCADWFDARDEALRAHATQIDPNGFWFAVPREVEREAWPTEDYELVKSVVDTTIPEDDLFAGLR